MVSAKKAVDMLASYGFASVAAVSQDGNEILDKTATFAASTAEISNIVANIGNESYSEGGVIVLNGVAYRLFKNDLNSLVAEDDGKGVIFRLSGDKWIIGVYDWDLNRDDADWEIYVIATAPYL